MLLGQVRTHAQWTGDFELGAHVRIKFHVMGYAARATGPDVPTAWHSRQSPSSMKEMMSLILTSTTRHGITSLLGFLSSSITWNTLPGPDILVRAGSLKTMSEFSSSSSFSTTPPSPAGNRSGLTRYFSKAPTSAFDPRLPASKHRDRSLSKVYWVQRISRWQLLASFEGNPFARTKMYLPFQ